MKKIDTQLITVPIQTKSSLEEIFKKAEEILAGRSQRPLRLILFDARRKSAKVLASFIYEEK